jgi:peroxiredoxin/tetratricopeptide (TPR) repeat protein
LILILSGWVLLAQEAPAPPMAGHSLHGEAFNEGPRQAARLLEGMGTVRFPVTAADERVRALFEQGVAQLHVFYYFEAERSFRQAAALDPDCAMAYWGMAMANVENEKRARGFLEKAEARAGKASPREQAWIKILTDYYKIPDGEKKKRAESYIKGLENILFQWPDEVEAKAFLAWTLWHHKDRGLPITSHQAVDALIADVLGVHPMHPGAHHYRIHLWDQEKPERALESARLFGAAAPGIAHAWHMPGHIYSKLHRYAEAAHQQEASARVDHAHQVREAIMPYQIHNYAHNNQWLAQDLTYVGRVRDAIAICENLIRIPRHPGRNKLEDGSSCARNGRARLLEALLEWELWDELAARADTTLGKIEPREDTALRARALGAAYYALGRLDRARELVRQLEADAKDNKSAQAAIHELSGRLALEGGSATDAVEHFTKAESRKDLLARACLAAGDAARAETLAQEAVASAPGRMAPLAHQVEILVKLGKTEPAVAACRRLMELAGEADADLPILKRLRPFAEEHGLKPAPAPKPSFDLASLGPMLWRPPAAPAWSLTDAEGRSWGSQRATQGPLLVLFYLGAGCSHCVEQLRKVAASETGFRESGVSIVAISSETPEQIRAGKTEVPFPLLSDPELSVFKAYRCFDDFEKMPLHGTFLLDAAPGETPRIRWQEISFTPFLEIPFLLEECRRLLALGP